MTRMPFRLSIQFALCLICVLAWTKAAAQTHVTAGYRDFSFGTVVTPEPTGEKPESKLWWNDGSWWGSLWNPQVNAYHIYRMDTASQTWMDTGTALDDRTKSKADVLWDPTSQKLYVASHRYYSLGQPLTTQVDWGRLYRYSYNPVQRIYTLDPNFPVTVTQGKSETLTIAKDSTGRLWVTYVESGKVMVNHSTGDDLMWGTPFVLPLTTAAVTVSSDDISSVIAFGGGKIGIMWSNQLTSTMYFAVHLDADPESTWQTEETALPGPSCAGACADDHINLKTDTAGRVFAATKTSLSKSSSDPVMMLLVRSAGGQWTGYPWGVLADKLTRPIVLLDETNSKIYTIATAPEGGGAVYYKTSDMNNISFAPGLGIPLLQSSSDVNIDNTTSVKQNLNSTTGLLVLASDMVTKFYLHNFLPIPGNELPTISSFTPSSGPAGTEITLTGVNFTGTTAVRFNGAAASAFTVDTDTRLRATVPENASPGKISVTNPAGTGQSTSDFNVVTVPMIASFSPTSGPTGIEVTLSGTGFTGTTLVAFGGVAATFIVDSDTQLRATVPSDATTGTISVTNPAGTGVSAIQFSVTGSSATFTPVADSQVVSTFPTKNYGTRTILNVRETATSSSYHSYLRFNVTGLSSTPLTSAKLRLYVSDGSVNTITASSTDNNWTESGITWNTAPPPEVFLGDSTGSVSGTWLEIILPTGVFAGGNGTYNFVLTSNGVDKLAFQSRENTNKPQLVLGQN